MKPHPTKPCGFAIVTALIFLGVVTMLAIAASRQGVIQNQVASSQRMESLAFGAAESALRSAENTLLNGYQSWGASGGVVGTMPWLHGRGAEASFAGLREFRRGNRWTTDASRAVPTTAVDFVDAAMTAPLPQQPRYSIEDLGPMRPAGSGGAHESGATGGAGYDGSAGVSPAGNHDLHVYRITGKALAPNGRQVRTLESTFAGRTRG
jgi:Tfp pilus assembly protein PilX